MLKSILLAIALGLCGVAKCGFAQSEDGGNQAKLVWKNGDTLPGKMLQADADDIRWHATSVFRDAVDLDSRFLQRIEFAAPDLNQKGDLPNGSAETKTAQYIVQTVDGMQLIGDILKLDEKQLTMSSDRFGEIEIARNRIGSIQNMRNVGTWGGNKIDLEQWKANRGYKKFWTVNELGQLESKRNNIHLFRDQKFPKSALIEVEFRWAKKLDFVFGLAVPKSGRQSDSIPRLETWDDSLVFSHGDNFEVILESFKGEEQRIKLLLHWDQEKKLISIHDELGTLQCQAELTKEHQSNRPGIFIENKSGDLIVSSLLVRESLPGFDSTRPSIQVVSKAAQNGSVIGFDGKQWIIDIEANQEANPQETKLEIAADQLNNAFSINPPQSAENAGVQILYTDGSSISGELQSYDGDRIQLKANFTNSPISLSTEGASKLIFFSSPPTIEQGQFVHELTTIAGTICGRLEPGSPSESDILFWRLPGAKERVPFGEADAKVVLAKKTDVKQPDELWQDTLYFFNRDVVPCRVLEIDEQAIKFESFTEKREIKPGLIKAIDFSGSKRSERIGFADANWRFDGVKNAQPKIVENVLHLAGGERAFHSGLLNTGGFEFEMKWKAGQYGHLEMKLFAGSKEGAVGGRPLTLMFYDEQLYLQSTDNGQRPIPVKGKKAKIRVRMVGKTLNLYVDGRKIDSETVPPDSIRGAGVSLSINDIQNAKIGVELSDVKSLDSEKNQGLFVDPQQKELLLTIPRIKKNNPPLHIFRASNADMLRGEIVALNENQIEFRAGHEIIQFPRSLVTTLIWLHFQDAKSNRESNGEQEVATGGETTTGATTTDAEAEHDQVTPSTDLKAKSSNAGNRQNVQVLMLGQRRLTLELRSWKENLLVGHSADLGECIVPFDQILELRFGTFANQAFDVPYSDWIAKLAPAPRMETGTDADSRSEMLFGSASPLIGKSVVDVTIPLMDGKALKLDQGVGKVVVLDFWATWCGPCIKGLPDLIEVTNEFSDKEVVFIGINQDEDVETIKAFQQARQLDFEVGMGEPKLIDQFEAHSIPKTIVIDPSGKIAFVKTGYSADQKEKLKAAIQKLLEVK